MFARSSKTCPVVRESPTFGGVMKPPVSLRERKNQMTREVITRAACELILERGYERATIPDIAERATVSPRTIHTWFGSKEDIVFGPVNEPLDRLEAHLSEGEGDTIDRFERWMLAERQLTTAEDELRPLRLAALAADPHLRALERERLSRLETAVAASIADEAGVAPDDLAALAFAAATVSVLLGLRARFPDRNSPDHAGVVAKGFELLRGFHAAALALEGSREVDAA